MFNGIWNAGGVDSHGYPNKPIGLKLRQIGCADWRSQRGGRQFISTIDAACVFFYASHNDHEGGRVCLTNA